MRVGRHIYWFLLGFALSAIVAAAFEPQSAAAQGAPTPRGRPPALRGTAPTQSPEQPLSTDDAAEDADGAAMSGATADDGLPDDPEAAAAAGTGIRGAVRDGDLSFPAEPLHPEDGLIETGEPQAAPDGADAGRIDARAPDDIAVFENPPAGYDPLLFQIEDVDPVQDRRIGRMFRFEPYDPKGIKVGSFVLFPEAEITGIAVRNALRAPLAKSDVAIETRPSLRLVSDWRMHALEFKASGAFNAHNQFASEDDRSYRLEMRGRLDIGKRTNVQVELLRDSILESRQVLEANRSGTRAEILTEGVQTALTHRFNRLTVQLRGGVTETGYGDVTIAGVRQPNGDRDYTKTTEAMRATWEFKPTLSGFAEVGLDQRSYGTAAFSDQISRSSTGERYRVGAAFGNTGAYLRGEASVGWGRQAAKDARLQDISGIIVDANLAWKVTALTTLAFTARTDFQDTNIAGSPGSVQRQGGIEVRHALRPFLIATAGLTYTAQTYTGISLDDRELKATLGLEYFVDRETVLFGRYQHTDYATSAVNAGYTDDEFRLGVRLRR